MQINNNLNKLRDEMINALLLAEYSSFTIKRFKEVFKKIGHDVQSKNCATYEDVFWKHYGGKSKSVERGGRWVLGAIEYFDISGQLPGGVRRSKIGKITKFDLLSEEFKSILSYYKKAEVKRGIKASTINVCFYGGISFFSALQLKGITEPSQITAKSVIDVLTDSNGKPCKSGSYRKNLISLFHACIDFLPGGVCDRIINYLPEIPCVRKNIQYLAEEEILKVKDALLGEQPSLTKRDRAIGLLAMYTGLRSGDIAGLLLENIDWINDTISITQQKTSKPLTLPLSATVGNTLYDYIHGERPAVSIQEVFVTLRPPFRRIVSGDCYNIATVIMKQAGIRTKNGDTRGFHLFRHHLATEMLAHDVPVTVISEILGHSSPNSTQAYLSADFIHLKACSLSIEQFPIREGVLR